METFISRYDINQQCHSRVPLHNVTTKWPDISRASTEYNSTDMKSSCVMADLNSENAVSPSSIASMQPAISKSSPEYSSGELNNVQGFFSSVC